jgi:hypothetical protein
MSEELLSGSSSFNVMVLCDFVLMLPVLDRDRAKRGEGVTKST